MPSIKSLEKDYALLKGRFEIADRVAEKVFGVHAVLEKWREIDSAKALIQREMKALEMVIRRSDPSWEGERIKPRYPKTSGRPQGAIPRATFAILKREARPMRTRELTLAVVVELELKDLDQRGLTAIDSHIRSALRHRIAQGTIILLDGTPQRWALASRDDVAKRVASKA